MRSSPRSIWRQGDKHGLSLRDIYMEQRLERATVIRRARSAQHNHGCCRFLVVELWYLRTWRRSDADKSYRIGSNAATDGGQQLEPTCPSLVLGFGDAVVCSPVFNVGRPRQPAKATRRWSLTKTCLAHHVVFHFLVPVAWDPSNAIVVCAPPPPSPRQMLFLSLPVSAMSNLPPPAVYTAPAPSFVSLRS